MNTILGIKSKMSQAYVGNTRVPVTVVKADPCVITQINENSIQIGTGEKKTKHTTKPLQGHLKKAFTEAPKTFPRFIKEIEKTDSDDVKIGGHVSMVDVFTEGDTVQVTGVSKGKGFQGGVKRWGFAGGPKTHGQSDRHRSPGSIGQGTTPGRVWKGKKMAGHMGQDTVTVKNLKVVRIDTDSNELYISGPVPGATGTILVIKRTSENKVGQVQEETTQENHEN